MDYNNINTSRRTLPTNEADAEANKFINKMINEIFFHYGKSWNAESAFTQNIFAQNSITKVPFRVGLDITVYLWYVIVKYYTNMQNINLI